MLVLEKPLPPAEGDSDSGDAGATEQSAAEAGEDRLQKKEK